MSYATSKPGGLSVCLSVSHSDSLSLSRSLFLAASAVVVKRREVKGRQAPVLQQVDRRRYLNREIGVALFVWVSFPSSLLGIVCLSLALRTPFSLSFSSQRGGEEFEFELSSLGPSPEGVEEI